jgi:hypothetical protein
MGKPREPRPVKLFMSLIAGEDDIFHRGMEALKKGFGVIDFVSEKFQFDFTDYYTKEMGENLFRHFITFEQLISCGLLPEFKLATNHLEERFADSNGNRRMNIDPGYLSHAQVILATTKAYAHRPYLEKGIYADLTLIYRDKSFQALEWTYPDYRQEATIQLFNQIRKQYLQTIKEGKNPLC